jgi:hypothetical protein
MIVLIAKQNTQIVRRFANKFGCKFVIGVAGACQFSRK